MKKFLTGIVIVGALSGTTQILESGPAHARTEVSTHSKANCKKIVQEIRRQNGSVSAQRYLGNFIAWRESGCSLQCVSDSDDHSCSRFGINFRGNMAKFWGKLCGAWNRSATKNLATDVKCALRAFNKYGTRPWRT